MLACTFCSLALSSWCSTVSMACDMASSLVIPEDTNVANAAVKRESASWYIAPLVRGMRSNRRMTPARPSRCASRATAERDDRADDGTGRMTMTVNARMTVMMTSRAAG